MHAYKHMQMQYKLYNVALKAAAGIKEAAQLAYTTLYDVTGEMAEEERMVQLQHHALAVSCFQSNS